MIEGGRSRIADPRQRSKESEKSSMGRRTIKLGALGVMDADFAPQKGDILVLFGTKDEGERFTGEND